LEDVAFDKGREVLPTEQSVHRGHEQAIEDPGCDQQMKHHGTGGRIHRPISQIGQHPSESTPVDSTHVAGNDDLDTGAA
jgi:hypothetical protein